MKIKIPALKAHFKTLKENMKGMTFKEKADHIWTYYKEYMLVAAIVIAMVVALLTAIFSEQKKLYTCGVMSNTELSLEGHEYLTDTFWKDVLGSPEGTVYLNKTELAWIEYTENDTHTNAQNVNAVLSQVEAKQLDYMLVDEYSLEYYAYENIFMSLGGLLSEAELQELESKGLLKPVRFYFSEEKYEDRPVAIDISQTAFGKDCLNTEGPVYLVFISNTDEKDNCLKLWEHIKAWESKS